MATNTTATSDQAFEVEVLKSTIPVLVDFWAEWCAPCRHLAPKLEEIATQFAGRVKIVKLDIDHNQATPEKYGVRSIPTLILFKDGKPVQQVVGNVPKDDLVRLVETSC